MESRKDDVDNLEVFVDGIQAGFSITEKHACVLFKEQRILHAYEAGSQTAFQNDCG